MNIPCHIAHCRGTLVCRAVPNILFIFYLVRIVKCTIWYSPTCLLLTDSWQWSQSFTAVVYKLVYKLISGLLAMPSSYHLT